MGGSHSAEHGYKNGIASFLNADLKIKETELWLAVFSSSENFTTFIRSLQYEDLRALVHQRPEHLKRILDQVLAIISYFMKKTNSPLFDGSDITESQAVLCIRFLTRIIPALIEDPENDSATLLLWSPAGSLKEDVEEPSMTETIESESKLYRDLTNTHLRGDTYGQEILLRLMELLFLRDFSFVDLRKSAVEAKHSEAINNIDFDAVWIGGIGSPANTHRKTRELKAENLTEVLRCLLVCLSEPLFKDIDTYFNSIPLWTHAVTIGLLKYTATLFASLMGLIFSYNPSGMSFQLELTAKPSSEAKLIKVACQVLIVLLDHDASAYAEKQGKEPANGDSPTPIKWKNAFREMLVGIQLDEEIDFILNGFLNQFILSTSGKSHVFITSMMHYQELMCLFWQVLYLNEKILQRLINSPSSNKVAFVLLYMMGLPKLLQYGRSSQLKDNTDIFLETCGLIFLQLSQHRTFATQLNSPFTERYLPFNIPYFHGTYADLMLVVFSKVLQGSSEIFGSCSKPLIEALLMSVTNISAYIKSFSDEGASAMTSLLRRFCHPRWGYKRDRTIKHTSLILEACCNILQFQSEGNTIFIYHLLVLKEYLESLKRASFQEEECLRLAVDSVELRTEEDKANYLAISRDIFLDWKASLPLASIFLAIDYLMPLVEKECDEQQITDFNEVFVYLKTLTLVGVLPPNQTIIRRNFQPSLALQLWFTSGIWSIISNCEEMLGLYDWSRFRMLSTSANKA